MHAHWAQTVRKGKTVQLLPIENDSIQLIKARLPIGTVFSLPSEYVSDAPTEG